MSAQRFHRPLGAGVLAALLYMAATAIAAEMPPAEAEPQLSEEDLPPLGTGQTVQLSGALGAYGMTRDASGTSWQPESAPMDAIHGIAGDWAYMLHGSLFAIYDHQGGPRGDDKGFSASMLMGVAQHALGPGQLTLKGMISLDPLMGRDGYPLLLQTGETANGSTALIDRQHPHDFLMELASLYSTPIGQDMSAFLYVAYPGEPALGPPAFMHRFSGMENPEAPISHHWLDSTHITFGVITAGLTRGGWKLEGSFFNGREPDQFRWDFDPLRLNSGSVRLSFNPDESWAFQASYGYLKSPEQLEPERDQHRLIASAIYNRKLASGNWQTTLAIGQNSFSDDAPALAAVLLESALRWNKHMVFARAETAAKDELFPAGDPRAATAFHVAKVSLGYVYDVPIAEHFSLGFGAVGSLYRLPSALQPVYGSNPASYMLFTRLKLT